MPHKYCGAYLLADLIENPTWPDSRHKTTNQQKREHGLASAAAARIGVFEEGKLVRDRYPNFYGMGFKTQAFVDIKLRLGSGDIQGGKIEVHVKNELQKITNIILIYTVFGDVDIRCKVVGISLRQIERTAMLIREIDGVESSRTSIVMDETDYDAVTKKWASLIRACADKIESTLPKNLEDAQSRATE